MKKHYCVFGIGAAGTLMMMLLGTTAIRADSDDIDDEPTMTSAFGK